MTIKNGVVSESECEETSTYKVSSRGQKGVQAVVKQSLELIQEGPTDKRAVGPFTKTAKINFEYSPKSTNDPEVNAAVSNKAYLSDLCTRVQEKSGLNNDHAQNFRALVNNLESLSTDDLLKYQAEADAKCKLAG